MSKLDLRLGKRIAKTKTQGLSRPTRTALTAFVKVQKRTEYADWQARQLPGELRMYTRFANEDRRICRRLLRAVVVALTKGGEKPQQLFVELGFMKPAELAKQKDTMLAGELKRLYTKLRGGSRLRAMTDDATGNLKFYAQRLERRLAGIVRTEARILAEPNAARARERTWLAALAKLRTAAKHGNDRIAGF